MMDIPPRAFAVWFANLSRWSTNSFFAIPWKWPSEVIVSLSTALERRSVAVEESETTNPRMVTLHFDGEMEPRDLRGKSDLKGKLLLAEAGDVIYSKIDVRNGAIGVVPSSMPRVAVTSEFPVYRVRKDIALPEYIKLLFRTKVFRQQINNMISGASGRKRVEPDALADIPVPLPSIKIQQAILAEWEKAQCDIAAAESSVISIKAEWERLFLERLGIMVDDPKPCQGAFVLQSKEMERWDTFFYRSDFICLEKQLRKTQNGRLGDLLNFISRPWAAKDFPHSYFRYVEIANVNHESGIMSCREVAVDHAPSRATTLIRTGDILIATTRPYLGAFTRVGPDYDGCVCSSGFAVADSVKAPNVDPEYLLMFLKSPAGLRQMERRMTGGLYPAIVQDELEKIVVTLPSKRVQQEIVEAYETACKRIAHERETARNISREIEADMESYLLGTKDVGRI